MTPCPTSTGTALRVMPGTSLCTTTAWPYQIEQAIAQRSTAGSLARAAKLLRSKICSKIDSVGAGAIVQPIAVNILSGMCKTTQRQALTRLATAFLETLKRSSSPRVRKTANCSSGASKNSAWPLNGSACQVMSPRRMAVSTACVPYTGCCRLRRNATGIPVPIWLTRLNMLFQLI